jgi:hypothetical protein
MDDQPQPVNEITPEAFEQLAPNRPSIQFMMLADRAEVHEGKLYVMGGVITEFWVQSFPGQLSFCVALVIDVPWHATNQPMNCHVAFQNEDGQELASFDMAMTTGRHPLLLQGDTSNVVIATPPLNLVVPSSGRYVVSATLGDDRVIRLPIRARLVGQ